MKKIIVLGINGLFAILLVMCVATSIIHIATSGTRLAVFSAVLLSLGVILNWYLFNRYFGKKGRSVS